MHDNKQNILVDVADLEFAYPHDDSFCLQNINLQVKAGEICAILGRNGCGKSTLMGCLAGIILPSRGTIIANGANISQMKPNVRAKNIAYVPQNSRPNDLSVYDTVMLGRRPYMSISATPRDHKIVGDVMHKLWLNKIAGKSTNNLSGGEFQKTCIARAFAQQAPVLLLDEPTNNLDVQNQHEIFSIIRQSVNDGNICAICVVHDVNLAVKYADKLIFIKNGQIVKTGNKEIVNVELLKEIYGIDAHIFEENDEKFIVI